MIRLCLATDVHIGKIVQLQIRQANNDDAEWIYQLYRLTMKSYIEATWEWDEKVQSDGINTQLGIENFTVFSASDEIAGCYCLKDKGDHLWLHLILVKPHWQDQGVGRAAMEHIQSLAGDKDKPLRFRALKINPAAEFYRHIGYSQYDEDEVRYYFEK